VTSAVSSPAESATALVDPILRAPAVESAAVQAVVEQPVVETAPLMPSRSSAAEITTPSGDPATIPDALVTIDPSVLLPVAGALGVVALTTSIARGVCTANAALVFTNVRLLPCYASATAQQMTASAAAVPSRARTIGGGIARSAPAVTSSLEKVAEGFGRVVVPSDDDGERLRDTRLLVQIGMVLGLVYAGFLTVWFWATRLRPNSRRMA
jgi:hypothetical protein